MNTCCLRVKHSGTYTQMQVKVPAKVNKASKKSKGNKKASFSRGNRGHRQVDDEAQTRFNMTPMQVHTRKNHEL